jgi:predicted RNase H-like HicB family nuclease
LEELERRKRRKSISVASRAHDRVLIILKGMLRYQVAYYLPKGPDRMVVAEVLDFPGVVSQGFDLADARLMIASALEDMARMLLEEGKPLPLPNADVTAPDADLIEFVPLSVEAGVPRS